MLQRLTKGKLALVIALLLIAHQGFATVYLFFASIVFGIREGFEGLNNQPLLAEFILQQSVIAVIFAGVFSLVLYYLLFKRESFVSFYRLYSPTKAQVGWSLLLGFSTVFLSGYLIELLALFNPVAVDEFIELFEDFSLGHPVAVFSAIVIVAPIFEEVLFRGVLFRLFERTSVRLVWTVILTSVLFGVFHLNIVQGLYASVLGLFIALALVYTNTLWVPIIIHFANNLHAYINGFDSVMDFYANNPILSAGISLISVVVLIPLSLYGLYRTRVPFDYDITPLPEPVTLEEDTLQAEALDVLDDDFTTRP